MARDARLLEGSLKKLDVDATWVRKSAVLSAWKAAMTGAKAVKPGKFDDAELRSLLGFDGNEPFRRSEAPGPLYATEYTGYPDRDDADFSAPLAPPGGAYSPKTYMGRAYS